MHGICYKMRVGLHTGVQFFCPTAAEIGMYRYILLKLSSIKLLENSLSRSRIVSCIHIKRQTDGSTERI
jgi:hypothetical protein